MSPDPKVLKSLRTGNKLTLAQEAEDEPLLALHEGKVAGSISGVRLDTLLKCISEGFEYEAEVLQVSGGTVEVEVKPVGV